MVDVNIVNLQKVFDKKEILKSINLQIKDGDFTVLLGPSGCGKTTLLRTIAGLENPTSGDIEIGNESVVEKEPKDRELAFVFQNYALYPHLSVYKNIEYSLKINKVPRGQREKMISEVLTQVDLTEHSKKLPSQLSGGQKQRVALARAMVKNPKVFLMDEPLSNLDAKLRNSMRSELKTIHNTTNGTFIYVTHDQVEAMSLADRIVILNEGDIVQVGSPQEIYEYPNSVFVAEFIGSPPTNIIEIEDFYIGIRPEHISENKNGNKTYALEVEIIDTDTLGEDMLYFFDSIIGKLVMKSTNTWAKNKKSKMNIFIEKSNIMVFDSSKHRESREREIEKVNELSKYFINN